MEDDFNMISINFDMISNESSTALDGCFFIKHTLYRQVYRL
jgi:hypothetical protein